MTEQSCGGEVPSSIDNQSTGAGMVTIDEHCEALIGRTALALWGRFPRDVQELIFETALDGNDDLRHDLAVFLHERHPRTAHPPKPAA
jgi:hypothetical protein